MPYLKSAKETEIQTDSNTVKAPGAVTAEVSISHRHSQEPPGSPDTDAPYAARQSLMILMRNSDSAQSARAHLNIAARIYMLTIMFTEIKTADCNAISLV